MGRRSQSAARAEALVLTRLQRALRGLTRESASDVIGQILGRTLRKKSQRGVSSEVRMGCIEPRAHPRVGTQEPPQRSHRKFDLAERVLSGPRMRPFRQRRRH
jgi:hypothetical protein